MLAGVVVYLVGLIDDVREISAPAKVAGQVLAAMVLVVLGVTMYYFKFPFDPRLITLSASALPLVTAAWVVGMTNAVNLIDGLDGLAAGIVAIASGSLCIYGIWLIHLGDLPNDNLGPLVAAATCGVAIGFLPHNFHPARIIMGDGGALFLGLEMAAATMVIGGRTANARASRGLDVSGLTFFRFAPLFIPFVILGVPFFDMTFAIVRRTARRASFAGSEISATSTIASSASVTATAGRCSSCGRGRPSFRRSSCCRSSIPAPTRSSLSGSACSAVAPLHGVPPGRHRRADGPP